MPVKIPREEPTQKGLESHTRDMKRLDENQLKETLKQAPWDAAFVNDDIDDVVNVWEQTLRY